MKDTFDRALKLLLRHEGGFVNHPRDPGGMTNLGVTRRAWEAYKGHAVSEEIMRALTPATVQPFYKARYWDAVRGDDLPKGLDFCVFDMAVNSGPGKAAKMLQQVLGVTQDGSIGPATIHAAKARPVGQLIDQYCAARLAFLKGLPTWATFGKGWQRRVEEVEAEALGFATNLIR